MIQLPYCSDIKTLCNNVLRLICVTLLPFSTQNTTPNQRKKEAKKERNTTKIYKTQKTPIVRACARTHARTHTHTHARARASTRTRSLPLSSCQNVAPRCCYAWLCALFHSFQVFSQQAHPKMIKTATYDDNIQNP